MANRPAIDPGDHPPRSWRRTTARNLGGPSLVLRAGELPRGRRRRDGAEELLGDVAQHRGARVTPGAMTLIPQPSAA